MQNSQPLHVRQQTYVRNTKKEFGKEAEVAMFSFIILFMVNGFCVCESHFFIQY